jgi:hypothetical protein
MPKDIIITPGTGLVEFRDDANVLDAQISLDNSGNLSITNTGGTLTVGNTAANVYIGDGINNVNMIFERNGSILPSSGQALTLGSQTSGDIFVGRALRLRPHNNEGGELLFDYINGSLGYYVDVQGGNVLRFGNSDTNGQYLWETNGTEKMRLLNNGNLGIGTNSPTNLLDVNSNSIRLRTARTPASATATGTQGEICWDANYIYVCTATNTWRRAALSAW